MDDIRLARPVLMHGVKVSLPTHFITIITHAASLMPPPASRHGGKARCLHLQTSAARRIKSCGAACKVYTQVANIHTKLANICTVLANIHSQVAFIVYAPGNTGLCAAFVRLACHPAQFAYSISSRDVVARVVVHRLPTDYHRTRLALSFHKAGGIPAIVASSIALDLHYLCFTKT